jgi:hypothetical protein
MTKNTLPKIFALGLALMLSMTATGLAQSTSGSIRGAALDPSGARIPHAQVTISNAEGFSRTIKSNAVGIFELGNIAPGSYSVSIIASGFTPSLEGGVQVRSDKVTQENIKLRISIYQEIEVLANNDSNARSQE